MKIAHRIAELAKQGPISRSAIYDAINEKRLVARKNGSTTIILEDDWQSFLKNLPTMEPRATKKQQAAEA